jgi:hypothetical protein
VISDAEIAAAHVVALSGGKDSTAMAARLAEIEPRNYLFVCTPTGDEPANVFDHFDRLERILGQTIIRLQHPRGLRGLIRDQRMVPNHRARWCTRLLKAEPYFDWLERQAPCVSYVGLRADELDRGGFDLAIPDISTDYPLRRWGWGIKEVRQYLSFRGIEIPKRTDCRRCFHQRLIEWWELWREDPTAYAEAEEDEAFTGHTFRSPKRDTWPASLRDLRVEFERGRVPKETRDRPGMCQMCLL